MTFRIALLASVAGVLAAQTGDPLAKGLAHFYNLEYDQAEAEFRREIRDKPAEPGPHNRLAQAIQFRELYRNGALESELVSGSNSFLRRPKVEATPEIEKQFFDAIEKAMSLAQARLDKNPNDTEALYSLGAAYGLRGNWNFLVRKAWRDALRDGTEGRKLHNRVTELDPNNYDARLMQGVHDYVVGSLPLLYKMIGFLVGFRGDKDEGIRTLQGVAEKGNRNRVDAQVFLLALYRRENRWKDAGPLLDRLIANYPRNHLFRFELAQMHSALGNKEQALAAIREVERLKSSGAPGYAKLPEGKILYQKATIQFWYRDYQESLQNFRRIEQNVDDLDLNMGVLTLMRIGQIHDVLNQREQAVAAYRRAIAFAPEAEAAKESRRYLSSPYRRESS
ncbi:MAG: DUF3808 domain-containing protein [Bryobacterales bacterium]|nr:DUF3808 domain-containing protein [Bryobacterales bacterium]